MTKIMTFPDYHMTNKCDILFIGMIKFYRGGNVMKIKKFMLITLVLPIISMSTSCSDQNNGNSEQTNNLQDNKPLAIYMQAYGNEFIKDAIDKFNSSEYGVIEPTIFPYGQEQKMGNEIETELVAGDGPDIIVFYYSDMPHLLKLIQNGLFCNLNEFIKEDNTFDVSNYNEKVMKLGVTNGSRYIMPLSYTLDGILFTSKQIIENNNFSISSRYILYDDFSNMAENYISKHSKENEYLVDMIYMPFFGSPMNLASQDIQLNSGEVIQSFKQYKEILGSSYYAGIKEFAFDNSLLPNGKTAFTYGTVSGLDMLPRVYSGYKSEVIPEIYSITMQDGENTAAIQPCMLAAINNSCDNKKAAYEFIKILMSDEIQRYNGIGLPINKTAYEEQKKAFISDPLMSVISKPNVTSYSADNSGIKESKTAEHIVRQIDEIMTGNLSFNFIDSTVTSILYEELVESSNGTKTPEEAVASIQKRISDYLNGNIMDYIRPSATPSPNLPVLTIQYMDSESAVRNAVKAFNEQRNDFRIEETVYSSSSRDEYVNKLITSVMAGEGPNIIYYDRYMFNSMSKTVSTGVFCDLNELIANDSTFKNLDLNNKILDSGVFDGKRYYIPLRYELPILMTTQGILDQNMINIDDSKWTFNEFKKIITDYVKSSGNKYFIDSNLLFKFLVNGCNVNFIDYKAKKADFQSRNFIDLMKFYKDIYPYITTAEMDMNNNLPEVRLQNKNIAMNFSFIHSPERIWSDNSTYNGILGKEPVIYPLPTFNQSYEIPVEFMNAVSINQNCKNKQAALDFIEELLSEDIQKAKDKNGNHNYTLGFPVNNKALQEELKGYMEPSAGGIQLSSGTQSFTSVPLSEDLAARITELTNRAYAGPEIDQVVYGIINEGLRSYLAGKQSAEEAAKDINNKVNLFLNE